MGGISTRNHRLRVSPGATLNPFSVSASASRAKMVADEVALVVLMTSLAGLKSPEAGRLFRNTPAKRNWSVPAPAVVAVQTAGCTRPIWKRWITLPVLVTVMGVPITLVEPGDKLPKLIAVVERSMPY